MGENEFIPAHSFYVISTKRLSSEIWIDSQSEACGISGKH